MILKEYLKILQGFNISSDGIHRMDPQLMNNEKSSSFNLEFSNVSLIYNFRI